MTAADELITTLRFTLMACRAHIARNSSGSDIDRKLIDAVDIAIDAADLYLAEQPGMGTPQ